MEGLCGMVDCEAVGADIELLAKKIVDAAYHVHKTIGPGLLESVYEVCLGFELSRRNLVFQRQLQIPIIYDGHKLDAGLRLDMLVEGKVIVELKSVETMIPLFEAQVLTYLKLTNHRLALLINFNVPLIKNGIRRIVL